MKALGSLTLGEVIFSVLVVCVAALALGDAIGEYKRAEASSKTAFTVVSVDAALNTELQDVKNYEDPTTKLALRSGRVPPQQVFNLRVKGLESEKTIAIHPNETLSLDRALNKCVNYPIGDCGYKIKLTLEAHPAAFSYEVASSFPEAALSLTRNGRTEVVIPKAFYRDPFHVQCDARHEVGLSGVTSSDRYDCVSRPQDECDRGTLPKAIAVDPKTHSLELECGHASKVVRCPASYALNKLDTKTLDSSEAINATCVRTTATVAYPVKQPEPSVHMVGRACPIGYKSDSTCTLVNVKSHPGKCGTGVAQAVPGKLVFSQNRHQGTVDCGVQLQSQTCGAIWEGLAQLKIKCVLDQPEFANALQ